MMHSYREENKSKLITGAAEVNLISAVLIERLNLKKDRLLAL